MSELELDEVLSDEVTHAVGRVGVAIHEGDPSAHEDMNVVLRTLRDAYREIAALRQQLATAREDARSDFFGAISAVAEAMDVAANGPNRPRHRRSLHAVAVPMNEILKAMQLCEANDAAAKGER